MPFSKTELIAQKYPELIKEYEEFKKLEEINKEKLKLVQQYLKHSDEGSLKNLTKLFKRIEKLMLIDKKEEIVEKKYTLILLHQLKDRKIYPEIKKLIISLKELSKLLSLQLNIIHSDKVKWGLKSNFQEFIQFVLAEQKIIKGDLQFLNEVTQHFQQQTNQDLIKNAMKVKIVGHRGARGLYPENTLGSMIVALKNGAQMIEFDVQRCKTGEIIVMHNIYGIQETTTGRGSVEKLSLKDIESLHVRGQGSEKIPTLEDVIKLLSPKYTMYIEIKAHKVNTKQIVDILNGVITLLRKYNVPRDKVIIQSFNHKLLRVLKSMKTGFRIAVLVDEDFGQTFLLGLGHFARKNIYDIGGKTSKYVFYKLYIKQALVLGAIAINPPMDMVDKNLITMAHERNLKVNVWTVNNPYAMIKLISWGVDGIITDRPDILFKVKNSLINGKIPEFSKVVKEV